MAYGLPQVGIIMPDLHRLRSIKICLHQQQLKITQRYTNIPSLWWWPTWRPQWLHKEKSYYFCLWTLIFS